MAKVEYKFKAYQPRKLKLASTTVKPGEANIKALKTQKENLEKRLRAEGVDPETLGGEFDNRNIIQKALNLTPNQGLLQDFIEVLDRPTQAIKQAILAGNKGENVLEAAFEGISGEAEAISTEETLNELGVDTSNLSGVEKFLVNISGDIILDPLTYIPAGFFVKGFKKLTTKTKTVFLSTAAETQEALIKKIMQEFPEKNVDEVMEIFAKRTSDDVYMLGNKTDFDGDLYVTKQGRVTLGSKYRNSIQGLEARAEKLEDIIKARA